MSNENIKNFDGLQKFGYNFSVLVPNALFAAGIYFILKIALFIFKHGKQQQEEGLDHQNYIQISILTTIVLFSAFLVLNIQVDNYRNGEEKRNDQSLRYFNWLIDVPLLLFIYGLILKLPLKKNIILCCLGVLMVIFGYFGVEETSYIFTVLSIAAFVAVGFILYRGSEKRKIKDSMLTFVIWAITWTIYVIPYFIQIERKSSGNDDKYDGVIEILYGVADLISKVFFPLWLLNRLRLAKTDLQKKV